MRRIAVQRPARDVAPEGFALASPINPLHDAVVGIHAGGIQDGKHARADALILVGARVKDEEGLADQLLARGAEHFADMLVAIEDRAVARQDKTYRCQIESQLVIR